MFQTKQIHISFGIWNRFTYAHWHINRLKIIFPVWQHLNIRYLFIIFLFLHKTGENRFKIKIYFETKVLIETVFSFFIWVDRIHSTNIQIERHSKFSCQTEEEAKHYAHELKITNTDGYKCIDAGLSSSLIGLINIYFLYIQLSNFEWIF